MFTEMGSNIEVETKKINVLGPLASGKTAFVNRVVKDQFLESYQSTIGVNFLTHPSNGSFHLHIWDISGAERLIPLIPMYMAGAACLVFVFDAGNKETNALNIQRYVSGIEGVCASYIESENSVDAIPKVLILAKSDKAEEAEINCEELVKACEGIKDTTTGLNLFKNVTRCSAKTSYNVNEAEKNIVLAIQEHDAIEQESQGVEQSERGILEGGTLVFSKQEPLTPTYPEVKWGKIFLVVGVILLIAIIIAAIVLLPPTGIAVAVGALFTKFAVFTGLGAITGFALNTAVFGVVAGVEIVAAALGGLISGLFQFMYFRYVVGPPRVVLPPNESQLSIVKDKASKGSMSPESGRDDTVEPENVSPDVFSPVFGAANPAQDGGNQPPSTEEKSTERDVPAPGSSGPGDDT